MAKALKAGDKVKWETSQGETHGEVIRKQTSNTRIKGQEVKASNSDPQYVVESAKTGAKAAHKPQSLKRA